MEDARLHLAHNLRLVMAERRLVQAQVAAGAGVSQKTVSNILNPTVGISPRIDSAQRIAEWLRIPLWRLLMPATDATELLDTSIQKILQNYTRLDADGRALVGTIAEREAHYRPKLAI